MPYKIIATEEKGQQKLCIVPSSWEKKGELSWPRKRIDIPRLVKDENSKPSPDWSLFKCCVKRHSVPTLEEAERELDQMIQNSDTDIDNTREVKHKNTNKNFNALAEHLVFNQESGSSTVPRTLVFPVEPTAAENNEFEFQYIVGNEFGLQSNSVQATTTNTEAETAYINAPEETNMTYVLESLKLLIDNQHNVSKSLNILIDNQKKIIHKIASLSVQIDDEFSKARDKTRHSNIVVPLCKSTTFEKESFHIKPIDSITAMEKFESTLTDNAQKTKLIRQYLFVCAESEGNGVTCAYKVLDMFFTREFLCMCSWTGGSRNSDRTKVGLKGYTNFLNFFFELIRSWDNTYTIEDNENFFKNVLKNSNKRKHNKNIRKSTKRIRKNKTRTETDTFEDPTELEYHTTTENDTITDITQEGEEESLC